MTSYLNHFETAVVQKQIIKFDQDTASRLGDLPQGEAFFDELLTGNETKQRTLGQFHTPSSVVDIVLEGLRESWIEEIIEGARLLDPSCGTGNFLISVVRHVAKKLALSNSPSNVNRIINEQVITRLVGAEIDPLLVRATRVNFERSFSGEIRCPQILEIDSLELESPSAGPLIGGFDFVVGNPPWVEVKTLPDTIKEAVQRKYRVSNLYAAFMLQSAHFLKDGGQLSFVIPRSFTGGRYHRVTRDFLRENVHLNKLFYFTDRNQTFHGGDVLQEIVIVSFEKRFPNSDSPVLCVPANTVTEFSTKKGFIVSRGRLFSDHDNLMLLASSVEELDWLVSISSHPNFVDHGFEFSTGQLVIHRSLDFLRADDSDGGHRVFYVHDIVVDGDRFSFRETATPIKGRKPYAVVIGRKNSDGRKKHLNGLSDELSIDNYCNRFNEVVVCRRRSHRGDKRRFVGVYLSHELPNQYFIENGLNYIYQRSKSPTSPSLKSLSRIMRSDIFEQYMGIVSSNTQLNKNDMYLFGVPKLNERSAEIYAKLESTDLNSLEQINASVRELYAAK